MSNPIWTALPKQKEKNRKDAKVTAILEKFRKDLADIKKQYTGDDEPDNSGVFTGRFNDGYA